MKTYKQLNEKIDRKYSADYVLSKTGRKVHPIEIEDKDAEKVHEEKNIEVTMKSGHKFTAPIKVSSKDWHIVKHPVSGKQYRVDHKGNTLSEENLDEISSKLAGDYYGAATKKHIAKVGVKSNMYDRIQKDMGKQRKAGIDRALDRVTGQRKTNEEVELSESYEEATEHLEKANASKKNSKDYHFHMSNHHEAMGNWHASKGRSHSAEREFNKAEAHHELGVDLKEHEEKAMTMEEQAPVAPVPDRKYIKGTPEHKAYKATKKPINGHPTNVKEESELDEVLSPEMGAGEYIKDFQKSDAPQFKGKSKEKRRMMGLAAYLAAKKKVDEEADLEEGRRYHGYQSHSGPSHGNPYGGSGFGRREREDDEYHNEPEHKPMYPPSNPTNTPKPVKKEEKVKKEEVELEETNFRPSNPAPTGSKSDSPGFQAYLAAQRAKRTALKKPAPAPVKEESELEEAKAANTASARAELANRPRKESDKEKEDKKKESDAAWERLMAHAAAQNKAGIKEELQTIDEANHREFAAQGKMHPDMAKHMKVGQEMDYYEHGTGDKVSGKVMKNDGKEVHIKQTHDSYDPKKKGTVHKFSVASKLDEAKKDDVPFDPPYKKAADNIKDKSGAVHTPMSRARDLARKAIKQQCKEEFDIELNDDEADQLMVEALVGGQAKLDKNKNGKVDSHDFKILRGEVCPECGKSPCECGTVKEAAYAGLEKEDKKELPTALIKKSSKAVKGDTVEGWDHPHKAVKKEDYEVETRSVSFGDFMSQLNEYTPGPGGVTRVQGKSYGAQYRDPEGEDDADDKKKQVAKSEPAVKRGRGRPAGSKSGANQKVTTGRKGSGVDYTGYKLHLPNSNR